jgi:hypothetical protein
MSNTANILDVVLVEMALVWVVAVVSMCMMFSLGLSELKWMQCFIS